MFYLPCTKEISCKAPPHLANLPYIFCRTAAFDPISRQLSLHPPKGNGNWDEDAYQISVQTNSAIILSLDVAGFEIRNGAVRSNYLSRNYDWGDLSDAKSWEPLPPNIQVAPANPEKPEPASPTQRISINETWSVLIEDIIFEDGKAHFTRFVYPTLGDTIFEIHHPSIRKEFDAIRTYFSAVLRSKHMECQVTRLH